MHIFYKRKQRVNNLLQQHVDAQSSVLGQDTANMSLRAFRSSAVKHTENTLQVVWVKEVRREKVSHKRNESGIPSGSLIYRFVYIVPHICVDSFLFHATVIRVSEKLKGLLAPERTYVSTAALKPLEKTKTILDQGDQKCAHWLNHSQS